MVARRLQIDRQRIRLAINLPTHDMYRSCGLQQQEFYHTVEAGVQPTLGAFHRTTFGLKIYIPHFELTPQIAALLAAVETDMLEQRSNRCHSADIDTRF